MTKQHKLPTRAEGIERLRTLYAVLAGIPKKLLNLRTFIDIEHPDPGVPNVKQLVHNCGSTACALGWAALYPEFNALGLRPDNEELPIFNNEEGFAAGRDFFALTSIEADVLFSSRNVFESEGYSTFLLAKELCEGLTLVKDRDAVRPENDMSDKRIALHRIRRFLELTDAITPERSAELAEIEKGY